MGFSRLKMYAIMPLRGLPEKRPFVPSQTNGRFPQDVRSFAPIRPFVFSRAVFRVLEESFIPLGTYMKHWNI